MLTMMSKRAGVCSPWAKSKNQTLSSGFGGTLVWPSGVFHRGVLINIFWVVLKEKGGLGVKRPVFNRRFVTAPLPWQRSINVLFQRFVSLESCNIAYLPSIQLSFPLPAPKPPKNGFHFPKLSLKFWCYFAD